MSRASYQLADVISPRQEQRSGVVLLPVRAEEREHDAHEDEQTAVGCHRVIAAAEHAVHADGHQQRRPAVQTVVEQLAQWTARVGPASLLAVRPIFMYTHTHTRLTALCPGLPG